MRAAARGHPVRYSAKLFALHDGFWRWAGGKLARRTDSAFDWRYDRAKSAVFPAQLRSAEATLSRLVAKTHVGGTELCEN